MEKCGDYFDGYFFGYMCRRKKNHTGRHIWWLEWNHGKTAIYWQPGVHTYFSKGRMKRV
jgi:hypothetical protein